MAFGSLPNIAGASDAELADYIRKNYPQFAPFLEIPDIAGVLFNAAREQWDAARLTGQVQATDWWKTHGDAARQWYSLQSTDPATAAQRKQQWIYQLNQLAVRNGVQMAATDLDWWAEHWLPLGVQPNDPQIIGEIARVYNERPDLRIGGKGAPAGEIPATIDQLKQTAANYLRDLSPADLAWWSGQIAAGMMTMAGFETVIRNQAKERFSSYASEIDAGATPKALFSDRQNAIAHELEISPEAVDLMHDPRWSNVLGVPDPATGKTRPMTYNEAIMLARHQPEWAKTHGAGTLGADLTTQLLTTMGAIVR